MKLMKRGRKKGGGLNNSIQNANGKWTGRARHDSQYLERVADDS